MGIAALESGKRIIVTTLQKFPVIAEGIASLPGRRFAVIVDAAHSSQSGESSKSLKSVLVSGDLEAAEAEEASAATYSAYWRLLKTIDDDPRYEKRRAAYLLRSFVELPSARRSRSWSSTSHRRRTTGSVPRPRP